MFPRRPYRWMAFLAALLVASPLLASGSGDDPAAHLARKAAPEELKKLRALLVIDADSNLGPSVEKDRHNLEWLLRTNLPADRLQITILRGKQASRDNILRHYKTLKTGADETLLFFYAGHGAIHEGKHCFTPKIGASTTLIPRAEVLRAMVEKKAGLVVLMSDCCSTPDTRVRGEEDSSPLRGLKEPSLHPVLRCLFFQHRGVVDVTAALDGTASFGDNKGGVFTRAMCDLLRKELKALDKNKDNFLSWQEFFEILSKKTEENFGRLVRAEGLDVRKLKQKTQKPRAFKLAEPVRPALAAREDQVRTYAVVSVTNKTGKDLRYQHRWSGEKDWKTADLDREGQEVFALPLQDNAEHLPTLQVKLLSTNGQGELKARKWTGASKPGFKEGEQYTIDPDQK